MVVMVVVGGGNGVGDMRKGDATLKHSGLFAQRPVHSYIQINSIR